MIPCFAESKYLFKTLYSLARNPAGEHLNTLVLCVINNRSSEKTTKDCFEDNQLTIKCLSMLIAGILDVDITLPFGLHNVLQDILTKNIRISYIDASSYGYELPDNGGGVGLARKMGLDVALTLFDTTNDVTKLLYCLDADTVVESNYLSSVRSYFNEEKKTAAYVSFAHQDAEEPSMQTAILCYEIFLRYYVAGLYYARSPYAFHTVGSTIICTADGYAAVRGMSQRQAGEDFYFLNKLAKLDNIGFINNTIVHPSARASQRVPFGTGQGILRYNGGSISDYLVYHPDIFCILKEWLENVEHGLDKGAQYLMRVARKIHPLLETFLKSYDFPVVWQRIQSNCGNILVLKGQFHRWFDGFITLKFIHYFSRNGISPINMFVAVDQLLKMLKSDFQLTFRLSNVPQTDDLRHVLDYLRKEIPA